MSQRRLGGALWCATLLVSSIVVAASEADTEGAPESPGLRDSGLIEKSRTGLVQIDITVVAPPDVVASLTEEDFRLRVHMRRIVDFRLDRLCDLRATENSPDADAVAVAGPRGASYLFYFDQAHLTLVGRQRALDLTRELVGRLMTGQNRAMILSSARRLSVIEPFTADRDRLLQALDRLEQDRTQWDDYPNTESIRVADILRALNQDEDVARAVGLARHYQREELWRADRGLRRLELSIGRMAGAAIPRAVFYFGDTLRANAGEHYLTFFGQQLRDTESTVTSIASRAFVGGLAFDRVIQAASAQGVRIYAVEARGLASLLDTSAATSGTMRMTLGATLPTRARITDTQNTLRDLSAETGGQAFLNGVEAERIAERVVDDGACLFLASFDPGDLPQDEPLRAVVEVRRPGVEVRVRGRIVVQSERARTTARLLGAFGSPEAISNAFELQTSLVPTGFARGSYTAMLQLTIPGTPLPDAVWDLGLTLLAGEKIHDEDSGRIRIPEAWVPVVFEAEIELKPGDYDVISVAHEAASGLVASSQLEVALPDPNREPVTVSDLVILQPRSGAFLREGHSRSSGSVAQRVAEPIRTDLPAAVVGLVCRAKRQPGAYRVERSLAGATVVELDALELDLSQDRCAQVRDVLPEHLLGPGRYRYELRVHDLAGAVQTESLEFNATAP